MEFKKNKPIYLQIVDYITEQIMLDLWISDERVPSVRDLAGEIEVNPNTVMRAFRSLEEKVILYNKRGVGFFVSTNAKETILEIDRSVFINEDLPTLFNKMTLLGLDINDLVSEYKKKYSY